MSGNDVPDKMAKAGFTITPSPNVDAPIINEYKLTLECKVVTFDSSKNEYRVIGEKIDTAWGAGKTIHEREVK